MRKKMKSLPWAIRLKTEEQIFLARHNRGVAEQLHRDIEQYQILLRYITERPDLTLGDLAPLLGDNCLVDGRK